VDGTIEVDGRSRTYHVHVPADAADGPVPLLIGLHGGLGSGEQFERNTGMNAVADANGFIAVYPDGIGGAAGNENLRTWNGGQCCGPAQRDDVDDVAFISALIDELSATYSVDSAQVFAVGHSNGGIMAYRLGCELADKVTGVGVYAATLGVAACEPSAPVSLIHVHGTADQNLPIAGGRGENSLAGVDFAPPVEGIETYAAVDDCGEPIITTNGDITTTSWSGCRDDSGVTFVKIDGASHAWPGGTGPANENLVGPAYADFAASEEIWAFLAAHPRPTDS
jgi:polyhydroxybutyrate depolymerase